MEPGTISSAGPPGRKGRDRTGGALPGDLNKRPYLPPLKPPDKPPPSGVYLVKSTEVRPRR